MMPPVSTSNVHASRPFTQNRNNTIITCPLSINEQQMEVGEDEIKPSAVKSIVSTSNINAYSNVHASRASTQNRNNIIITCPLSINEQQTEAGTDKRKPGAVESIESISNINAYSNVHASRANTQNRNNTIITCPLSVNEQPWEP